MAVLKGEGGLVMEDVEKRETNYGQGGINYRHEYHRIIQLLHHRTITIYRPPNDTVRDQGVWRVEEPQMTMR